MKKDYNTQINSKIAAQKNEKSARIMPDAFVWKWDVSVFI